MTPHYINKESEIYLLKCSPTEYLIPWSERWHKLVTGELASNMLGNEELGSFHKPL